MNIDSVKFKGYRCFKNDWAGFEAIKPINVIIGRNNSGKSHLLDLVAALCDSQLKKKEWHWQCHGVLDEVTLRNYFSENSSGGAMQGDWWRAHGIGFIGNKVSWEIDDNGQVAAIQPEPCRIQPTYGGDPNPGRLEVLKHLATQTRHQLNGHAFRRLFADRDIQPEAGNTTSLQLSESGVGATNIIRRYGRTGRGFFFQRRYSNLRRSRWTGNGLNRLGL